MIRKLAIATVAVLAFAQWSVPAFAQDGKAAFDGACARCHDLPQAMSYMKKHPDAAERAAWLEQKLSRHHARDATLRAAIIVYLEEAYAGEAGK